MRLGIFGGSFDPVHYGHLLLAECCRDQCGLDEVWFVPAAVPPHKQQATLTAANHRLEMLRLATGGDTAFAVCTLELDRGGLSYTVDTLANIRADQPNDDLFLLLGADSLADLPNWRAPARICELALPVGVRRPAIDGSAAPEPDFEMLAPLISAERLELIRRQHVEMPVIGLSASEIRRSVAAGQSIRYRTPRAVERYIKTHGLYRDS
jgi:nicotinate-nucleotide adenylyltransferase